MTPEKLPPKSAPTANEQRARRQERLTMIRLRVAIWQELDNRGISTPSGVAEALRMPAAEAHGLLRRRQWREGDVALLQGAAAKLGLPAGTAKDD